MTALMGANQAAAGRAFANTQQRVQNLRDQGRTAAQAASDTQYNRGVAAKNAYTNSIGNIDAAQSKYFDTSKNFRNEKLGYDTNAANIGLNTAQQDMGFSNDSVNRGLAAENQYEGQQRGMASADIAAENAAQAGKVGMFGTLLGTGVGAAAGGQQGAQLGSQVGGQVGRGMGASSQTGQYGQPQYGYGQ